MAESGVLSQSYENGKFILEIVWSVTKTNSSNYTKTIEWEARFTNNADRQISVSSGGITCKRFGKSVYEELNSSMPRYFPAHSTTVIERNALWGTTTYEDDIVFDVYGKASPFIDYNIRYQSSIDGVFYDSFKVSGSVQLEPFDKIITATLDSGDINIGETLKITASYKAKCSYELSLKLNGLVETIAAGESASKGNVITWTVPESFASVILNSSKIGVGTVECKTYDTATKTLIGSKSYLLTLHVPDSDKPEIKVSVKAFSSITGNQLQNINLAGVTYFKITNTVTPKNGAAVQSINTTIYGQTYPGEEITTNVIPRTAGGSIPITVKATDSRGLFNEARHYVEITPYKLPKISNFAVHRCLSDGTLDDEGNCSLVEYSFEVDALEENNVKRNSIASASINISETDSKNSLGEYSINCAGKQTFSGKTLIPDLDTEKTFEIRLTLYDKVTYVYETMPLSTAFTIVDFYKDGTGMKIGGVATKPNLVEFDLPVQFNKNFMPTAQWINENTIASVGAYLGYEGFEDILGLQVDFENKKFTRLAGAVGLNAGTDFDGFTMYGGRKRCNVADDGKITAIYGDTNYTDDGTNGQVMVYQPKFYYKVVPLKLEKNTATGIGYHIRKANYYVSGTQKPGFKLHPAFYNENGNEVDYILYSAYEGVLKRAADSGYYNDAQNTNTTLNTETDLICSVSSQKPISGQNLALNITNAEKLCSNRGQGWHNEAIKALSANQLLMMIEYNTLDMQTAIGKGVCMVSDVTGKNCACNTGATRTLGNATGNATLTYNITDGVGTTYRENGFLSLSYRGVENPYGNIVQMISGINYKGDESGVNRVYIADDFNFAVNKTDGNYHSPELTVANDYGYINAFGYDEKYDWLFMPSEIGGTSALPVGDRLAVVSNSTVDKIMLNGGLWNQSTYCGAFHTDFQSNYNQAMRMNGCRLVYIPTIH